MSVPDGSESSITARQVNRRAFLTLAAGSAMGLAFACAPAQPQPKVQQPAQAPAVGKRPLDVVRRGNLRGITFQSAIAKAQGYYAEMGIDDQETTFDSGAQMSQAMAAGQIDIQATSNTSAFYNIIARGVHQPFVGDNWHLAEGDNSYMIVVRPDIADRFREITDLRGTRNAQSTPEKDGGSWFIARKMFERVGMTLEEVEWQRLAFPDMGVGFANQSIDAAWMIEPFITLNKQRDLIAPWLNLGDHDPGAQIAGMGFSESFVRDRLDVARRWMVATVRGHRDFNDYLKGQKRDVIGPILAAHTGVPAELVDQVGWGPLHPDGLLNIDSLMESQEMLREWGKIEQVLPPDQIVDHQFVEYAVEQLGPYQG